MNYTDDLYDEVLEIMHDFLNEVYINELHLNNLNKGLFLTKSQKEILYKQFITQMIDMDLNKFKKSNKSFIDNLNHIYTYIGDTIIRSDMKLKFLSKLNIIENRYKALSKKFVILLDSSLLEGNNVISKEELVEYITDMFNNIENVYIINKLHDLELIKKSNVLGLFLNNTLEKKYGVYEEDIKKLNNFCSFPILDPKISVLKKGSSTFNNATAKEYNALLKKCILEKVLEFKLYLDNKLNFYLDNK